MLWPLWVVLITGSTGSALRAVRPPNLHITPVVRRDFVYRASAKDGPDHSGDLVGERDSRNLGRPPRQQGRKPGPMLGAMDFGVTDDRKRAGHKQAAQIAITLFAFA